MRGWFPSYMSGIKKMIQNYKLKMKPKAVRVSGISLSKVISQKIVVSADLAPDLDPVQGIA